MHDFGSIFSIFGAQNFWPGIRSPNEFLLLDPKRSPPVFESPMIHVEFLWRQSKARNVRLNLVPSATDPFSMQCSNTSWDLRVMWYNDRCSQVLNVSFWVPRSVYLILQVSPKETVKTDDSGFMVTSLSECWGRWLSDPSYLLMRQELIWGAGSPFCLCYGYISWYSLVWRSFILSMSDFMAVGMGGTLVDDFALV